MKVAKNISKEIDYNWIYKEMNDNVFYDLNFLEDEYYLVVTFKKKENLNVEARRVFTFLSKEEVDYLKYLLDLF